MSFKHLQNSLDSTDWCESFVFLRWSNYFATRPSSLAGLNSLMWTPATCDWERLSARLPSSVTLCPACGSSQQNYPTLTKKVGWYSKA